jgi:hypothetical protein
VDLIEELAGFSSDPLGFVLFAFPWGEEGTELENFEGPDEWATQVLIDLGEGALSVAEAVQIARASGHGIGKSALVAWIILWAISTFEDTKGVVTANTENQLKTKTWAELSKWHRLFIAREYFKLTATALYANDPLHERTWRIDMVPWSERNTEAFRRTPQPRQAYSRYLRRGLRHSRSNLGGYGRRADGPNTQIIWAAFGNPTRNKGRFRDCFPGGRFAHRWQPETIDSARSRCRTRNRSTLD